MSVELCKCHVVPSSICIVCTHSVFDHRSTITARPLQPIYWSSDVHTGNVIGSFIFRWERQVRRIRDRCRPKAGSASSRTIDDRPRRIVPTSAAVLASSRSSPRRRCSWSGAVRRDALPWRGRGAAFSQPPGNTRSRLRSAGRRGVCACVGRRQPSHKPAHQPHAPFHA
jgi:hypothetical protein